VTHTSDAQAFVTGREVLTHFLRREVKAFSSYEPMVRLDHDPEAVHQLRVSARRLRSELQAMRSVLPRQPWRGVIDDLQWMGSSLGGLRDLDVLSRLFAGHLVEGTDLREAVETKLSRRREGRRQEVEAMLASTRYARLVKGLGRLARRPELGDDGDTPAQELFWPPLWDATCTYFELIGDPYERRSDDALHRVRIASKKCRYSFEVAALFLGDPARSVATSLGQIQNILGEVHDRSVAVTFLDTLHFAEEVDIDLRRELRAEIGVLRPQWMVHYETARRAMLDVFGQG
jgi:CHAD domain-containing protein